LNGIPNVEVSPGQALSGKNKTNEQNNKATQREKESSATQNGVSAPGQEATRHGQTDLGVEVKALGPLLIYNRATLRTLLGSHSERP